MSMKGNGENGDEKDEDENEKDENEKFETAGCGPCDDGLADRVWKQRPGDCAVSRQQHGDTDEQRHAD